MEAALPDGPRGRILAIALTLAVFATLWFGGIQPLINWHAEGNESLEQRSALLRRMAGLVATLPDLRRQASSVRAPAAALLGDASDAVAGATLQGAVQGMAKTAGAALSSIETLPVEQRGVYRRIGLRVATSAPWPVLVTLLHSVEEGTPRMLIDNLQLRAPPVELRAANSPVSAAFTVVAFRAPPAGSGPASGRGNSPANTPGRDQ